MASSAAVEVETAADEDGVSKRDRWQGNSEELAAVLRPHATTKSFISYPSEFAVVTQASVLSDEVLKHKLIITKLKACRFSLAGRPPKMF